MNKKLLSTLLLFAVFVGFLWWGISMLLVAVEFLPDEIGPDSAAQVAFELLALQFLQVRRLGQKE